MSARPHGPTRAGAWRGGCHSESSAIAAVTDPAMLVQTWRVAVPIGKRMSIVAQLIVSTLVWSLASAHYTVVWPQSPESDHGRPLQSSSAHTLAQAQIAALVTFNSPESRRSSASQQPPATVAPYAIDHCYPPHCRASKLFPQESCFSWYTLPPSTTVWAPDSAVALCSTGVSGVSQVAACAMKISSIGPSQSRQVSRPARQLSTSGSAAAANSLHLVETLPGIARSLRALTSHQVILLPLRTF